MFKKLLLLFVLLSPMISFAQSGNQTVAYSSTLAFDPSTYLSGQSVLTGNVTTFTLVAGGTAGQTYGLTFCQDSVGSRIINSGPSNYSGSVELNSTPNYCTILSLIWLNSKWQVNKTTLSPQGAGILTPAEGGTGDSTLTGLRYANGASADTAATSSQIATWLNTSPSTKIAITVLPTGTSGATIPLVNGNITWSGTNAHGPNLVSGSNFVLTGGSLNGMSIGLSTPAVGKFTLLTTNLYTVSTLPPASSVLVGTQVTISDGLTYTAGVCTGGGSDYQIAISDGISVWSCH
jgi:hypothetical protein